MLGVARKPAVVGNQMQPIQAWGLSCMSIGLLVDQDTAMIWRGPMVMGALEQMMGQVGWGELDVMIVDMPPGTGDAQLTMAQRVSLSGALGNAKRAQRTTPLLASSLPRSAGRAMAARTPLPPLRLRSSNPDVFRTN